MPSFLPNRKVLSISFNRKLLKVYQRMNSSGINADGTLKKYDKPVPTSAVSVAAYNNDIAKLSSFNSIDLLAIDEIGNTALIWCADQGHIDSLNIILATIEKEDPSAVNVRGFLGNTALARACRGGHYDCVSWLLNSTEINPNIANEKMQYPLHFAAFKKHPNIVKLLLESKKCDSMVLDRKGRTPAEDTSDEHIRLMIINSR